MPTPRLPMTTPARIGMRRIIRQAWRMSRPVWSVQPIRRCTRWLIVGPRHVKGFAPCPLLDEVAVEGERPLSDVAPAEVSENAGPRRLAHPLPPRRIVDQRIDAGGEVARETRRIARLG